MSLLVINTPYFLSFSQVSVRYFLLFTSWWPTSLYPPALVSRNKNKSDYWSQTGVPFETEDRSKRRVTTVVPRCQNPACVFSASAIGLLTLCIIAVMEHFNLYSCGPQSLFLIEAHNKISHWGKSWTRGGGHLMQKDINVIFSPDALVNKIIYWN